MGEMLEVISDTERLANDLSLADFITDFVKDQVITTVLSRYEKASKLLNEVQRSLKVFNKPEMLTLYCEVLKKQKNPALKMIAQDMLKELGQLVIECFVVACSMIGGIFRMCSVIWDSDYYHHLLLLLLLLLLTLPHMGRAQGYCNHVFSL